MQDIYSQKSRWKILLAIAGFVIVLITMIYANYLADRLATNEENNVKLFAKAIKSVVSETDKDIEIELEILEKLNNIPVILESETGILQGENYEDTTITDQVFLQRELIEIKKNDYESIDGPPGYARHIYYKNSKLYSLITYFPIVQVSLLICFILLGYYLFSTARKSEQNRVWAGMAKETAHQLGTPISAIIGWIEHLKESATNDQSEIITELSADVYKLELIADRFSKIGSTPILSKVNIIRQMKKNFVYMQRRAPKRLHFELKQSEDKLFASVNEHLFDWVIENLIRNALDAMGNEGAITATIYKENEYVCVDLSDTGKGIPISKHITIFQPGFSTKKRGWGLGLSLAKRIVENYHSGKIYVKSSKIDEGSTFTIKVPSLD